MLAGLRRGGNVVGALGVAAGCAGMVAMLPGAVASALGLVGITGSSAFARTLSPVAEPLFLASAAFLVVGALLCSRLVTLLAVAGTALLYLSMWVLPSGAPAGMAGMSAMTSSQQLARAEPASFFSGLALVIASLAMSVWRRRKARCRPLLALPRPRTS